MCQQQEQHFRDLSMDNSQLLRQEQQLLVERATAFKNLVGQIQKENQLHLNQYHLSIIGGSTLAVLSLFSAPLALMMAAGAY